MVCESVQRTKEMNECPGDTEEKSPKILCQSLKKLIRKLIFIRVSLFDSLYLSNEKKERNQEVKTTPDRIQNYESKYLRKHLYIFSSSLFITEICFSQKEVFHNSLLLLCIIFKTRVNHFQKILRAEKNPPRHKVLCGT